MERATVNLQRSLKRAPPEAGRAAADKARRRHARRVGPEQDRRRRIGGNGQAIGAKTPSAQFSRAGRRERC
jgi:hypothetical protein